MAEISFGKSDFQFAHLDDKFKPRIVSIFNQTDRCNVSIKPKLGLREVILLDIQSTMDIFCNRYLLENTTKSKKKIILNSNGATMTVSHQSMVNGYHNSVCFSENAITNIIALINMCL